MSCPPRGSRGDLSAPQDSTQTGHFFVAHSRCRQGRFVRALSPAPARSGPRRYGPIRAASTRTATNATGSSCSDSSNTPRREPADGIICSIISVTAARFQRNVVTVTSATLLPLCRERSRRADLGNCWRTGRSSSMMPRRYSPSSRNAVDTSRDFTGSTSHGKATTIVFGSSPQLLPAGL